MLDAEALGLGTAFTVPATALGTARDIYEQLGARAYVERLEELAGCRISAIGVGPDRADTIAVHDLLPDPAQQRPAGA